MREFCCRRPRGEAGASELAESTGASDALPRGSFQTANTIGREVTRYACIWEFSVLPSRVDEFERHYGPAGTWVRLFRRSKGFVETLLLRDSDDPLRYVTIDRWRSAEHYSEFQSQYKREYEELDARCEALTTQERSLGNVFEVT